MPVFAVITAVLLFCLLIAAHEFGHYASAKLLGVKVNEFSIGMGPLIWQKSGKETEYSLRALPIGGYCRIEGEDGDSEHDRSFGRKPWWARVIILASGAFMNFALCLLLLLGVFWYSGAYSTTLDAVNPGSPAEAAGLRSEDIIRSIDGEAMDDWLTVVDRIGSSEGKAMSIEAERDGELLEFTAYASKSEDRWMLGISCRTVHSPLKAGAQALRVTGSTMRSMGQFFAQLFTGRASTDEVVGVVGIVSMISREARYGIASVCYFMAIISLNLGMVNLLPLPALDGGRILFVLVRLLTRDKFGKKAESYTHAVGMVLLLALMAFLVVRDVGRFIL